MDESDNAEVLEEIRRLQKQTKLEVRKESWRYLAVWAAVFLGAFISSFTDLAGWYWLLGVPAGYLGMYLAYRNVDESKVGTKSWPYAVTGIMIGVANGIASAVLPDEQIVVAIWVVLGTGFAILSWIDRQPLAAALFTSLALLALALGLHRRQPLCPLFGARPHLQLHHRRNRSRALALGPALMTHPSRALDEVVHQKNRLGILAVSGRGRLR